MNEYTQFPPRLLLRATKRLMLGDVHFISPRETTAAEDDGFKIFRKVVLDPVPSQPESPGAVFKVTFRFSKFSFKINRILSLIPISFIVAQPGFRSKTWLFNMHSSLFQGYYEFDSLEVAERYFDSFPLKMMKKRAAAGSLTHEILSR